jgi:hypothetical protein
VTAVRVPVRCLHEGRPGWGDPAEIYTRTVHTDETSARRAIRVFRQAHPDLDAWLKSRSLGDRSEPPEHLQDAAAELAQLTWSLIFEVAKSADELTADDGHTRFYTAGGEWLPSWLDDEIGAPGVYAHHMLRCECGITERVTSEELIRAMKFIATRPGTGPRFLPLGGIKRIVDRT